MQKTKAVTEKPRRRTRAQAIRAKCLDCCCDSTLGVKKCELKNCPLWLYRLGYETDFNGEYRKHRAITDTQYPPEENYLSL